MPAEVRKTEVALPSEIPRKDVTVPTEVRETDVGVPSEMQGTDVAERTEVQGTGVAMSSEVPTGVRLRDEKTGESLAAVSEKGVLSFRYTASNLPKLLFFLLSCFLYTMYSGKLSREKTLANLSVYWQQFSGCGILLMA